MGLDIFLKIDTNWFLNRTINTNFIILACVLSENRSNKKN